MKERVVITGMGCVSPIGCIPDILFDNIKLGRSNFSKLKETKDSALVSLVVESEYNQVCKLYGIDQCKSLTNYMCVAIAQALSQAKIQLHSSEIKDASLYVGSSKGFLFSNNTLFENNKIELDGLYPIDILSSVTTRIGIAGEALLIPVACSGGNAAISLGANKIRCNETELAIVGGVDIYNDLCYAIFASLGIISKRSNTPFMQGRDGITIGEGAGFLILENLDHALKRGAQILAEVKGYSNSCDAYHLNTPNPNGSEAAKCMLKAIVNSGLTPDDIDCIMPHGTGTYSNDLQEYNAIKSVFGEKTAKIPVCAIKSNLGHCMGAASALSAILSVLFLEKQNVPSTLNLYNEKSEYCLNLFDRTEEQQINNIINNAFAFGGNISCVVISKYQQ